MALQIAHQLFTVRDYHQMASAGILHEEDRVELIDGEIREMSPIDAVHAAIVKRLGRLINGAIGNRFIVGIQDPVQLSDLTEPQPDISVLRWHDDYYEQAHPTPGDTLILIEVANSSITYDRDEKLPRYALSGIPESWLISIAQQTVEQYTNPVDGQYAEKRTYRKGTTLRATTIPNFELSVNRIFGL